MADQPLDAAAVEAARKFIDSHEELFRSFGMGVGEYASLIEPLARIITEAYKPRRTRERAVREKLVEALVHQKCRCTPNSNLTDPFTYVTKCSRCTALAAAAKLEDIDA